MNLKSKAPTKKILTSFNVKEEPISLAGGIHGAFKASNFVFKKVESEKTYNWICENILSLNFNEITIQKPLKSKDGTWVVDGWCSYEYIPGVFLEGELKRKLQLFDLFHSQIEHIDSKDMPKENNPWRLAEKIIWGEKNLSEIQTNDFVFLESFMSGIKNESQVFQIVHCDFSGNILLDSQEDQASVIDLSLSARPLNFAKAILIYDSVLWHKGDIKDAEGWLSNDKNLSDLKKAICFRLIVSSHFDALLERSHFQGELAAARNFFSKYLGDF